VVFDEDAVAAEEFAGELGDLAGFSTVGVFGEGEHGTGYFAIFHKAGQLETQ